jgi:hypothetical protein
MLGLLKGRRPVEERMGEMMERLGVDAVSLAESRLGLDLIDAAKTCARCGKVGVCETWLAGRDRGKDPNTFCPNGALFDEHKQK